MKRVSLPSAGHAVATSFTPAEQLRYEPALDGLRAVAIMAVVVVHSYPALLPGGWAGVDVFFVLSGYLITRLLARELENTGRIDRVRFYIRRCLRLMPAFAVLLAEELIRGLFFSAHREENLQAVIIAATYLMNWNIAFYWFAQGSLGHTWSLAMEEQFYLVWPAILPLIFFRKPIAWVCGGIVVIFCWRMYLVQHGADPDRTYMGFDTHADALLIGCAMALVPLSINLRTVARRLSFIPLIAMAVVFATFHHRTNLSQGIGLSIAAFASAWIVVAGLEPGWLNRLLSLKPLTYTGRISYGWYLWHFPILVAIRPHVSPALALALIPLGYLVAVASYHIVEMPFLRLKDRFKASPDPVLTNKKSPAARTAGERLGTPA